MHPFEQNSKNALEAEISRAAARLGIDKAHVICMLSLQLEAISRGIENGRRDHGDDLRKARADANIADKLCLNGLTKDEAQKIVEATAIAMTEAKGVDPKTRYQINVFTGEEAFDHEDECGLRYEYAWRRQVPAAKAAVRTIIGLIG
ncbi:hypothetical protein [Roseibium sp. RKSG952]|uniref:hypothetical protein n=1 Tax=Roseibium sp. RKSG952 TaxID=2529384 RepID=UPI0012BC1877|nr:hypothetical protein [Roseibium sp. RKSG952]MTH95716.1 hypothetical protein [Roseibium sp. RKSG952]